MVKEEVIQRQQSLSKTPMLKRIATISESLSKAGDEAQQLRHLPA